MEAALFAIARRFWPELGEFNHQRKILGTGEVIGFLYSAPAALAGMVWLIFTSDFTLLIQKWSLFLLIAGLMFLFRKLGYFFISEIRVGRYASADGSMESMVLWLGLLLTGPTVLWIAVVGSTIDLIWSWPGLHTSFDRWNRRRNFSFYLASTVLAPLVAFSFYRRWGGEIPIAGLALRALLPAFGAIVAHFLLVMLIWLGFSLYVIWAQITLVHSSSGLPTAPPIKWRLIQPVVRFLALALGLPNLSHPFAILGSGLFVQHGWPVFAVFILGLLLVAVLTRQLSWAAERDRQRSRQLEKLEELGRLILRAPSDASTLPELLQECIPSMFPSGRLVLWVPEEILLVKHPSDWEIDIDPIWAWMKKQPNPAPNVAYAFLARDALPWQEAELPDNDAPDDKRAKNIARSRRSLHHPLVVAPILGVESNRLIGGVYLELYSLAQPWDRRSLESLFPAILSLVAQVASALHAAAMYAQALAYQKVSQELALAGKIQASFLPDELPRLNGWQLAVTLLPARETSGDFFDLISLTDRKLGLLIADVTDKGVGAALYMALSRTLIRTYAVEFDDDPQPDVVFFAANGRILKDARADLFVTAFYGILDLETGILTYANAGHNPPYLLRASNGAGERTIEALIPTGMPIGIEEEAVWAQETIQLLPGDVLVLYTDGIPDSQNMRGELFQDELLLETIKNCQDWQANEIQDAILGRVQEFIGEAPQFDDITLMVLLRESGAAESIQWDERARLGDIQEEHNPSPLLEAAGEDNT